jgi:CRISPR/Cas system CSM-associated protein Csm3 (group 7 of RAMP superfamily)
MRLRIVYTIEARSGVLIGSTAEALNIGIDKTTIRHKRVREGQNHGLTQEPIIPGSTIKGKIRSEAERLLRTFGHSVCIAPRADTMCPHGRERAEPLLCPACQLFGGPSNHSRLFFSDATSVLSEGLAPFVTRVQAGVSLSRKRRVAENERLYYIERGIEGIHYQGIIDGYLNSDVADQQVALLIVALENLIAIGGGKSRGAGWTKAVISSVELDGKQISGDEIKRIREGLRVWQR